MTVEYLVVVFLMKNQGHHLDNSTFISPALNMQLISSTIIDVIH